MLLLPVVVAAEAVEDDGFDVVEVDLPAPAIEESDVAEFVAEPAVSQAARQSAPISLGEGQVRLTMNFSGDCWTDISDASGRQLYFDLGQAGRSAEVTGEAPLSVLFGDAANVSVRVNGADYLISPADLIGEIAKLTIYSP